MTKSGESRKVPLNDAALGVVAKYLMTCGGGRLFKSCEIKEAFYFAMKRAGIEGARFHDLRRTFATQLMEGGIAMGKIARLLGHSSVITTERYLVYGDENLLECVSVVNFQ
jgi:integrase